jgi:hypothetical protein
MKHKPYPYWIREDYLNGLYETAISNEDIHAQKVIDLFNSEYRTIKAMSAVIRNWKKATEHNLSNTSINRVAWLGQAACCYRFKTPDYLTKKAWWKLPKETRDRADKNAKDLIEDYESKIKNECFGSCETENQFCF